MRKLIKKLFSKSKAIWYMHVVNFMCASSAWAGDPYNPIGVVETKTFTDKIVQLVQQVGMPLGGAILFVSVSVIAIKLILSGLKSDARDRSEALGGLMWIAGGGILLGGALVVAGFFFGIGAELQK